MNVTVLGAVGCVIGGGNKGWSIGASLGGDL